MASRPLPAQAQQLFQYLFEQASLGIAVEDLDGNLLLANPALCSMLGYGDDEMRGMSCSQFAHPEDSKDDWALFQQLRAGLIERYSLEKRYVTKDGTHLWGRLNVSLLKNGEGESPLVFAFVENITEHKIGEAALANLSRRLIEAQEQERARIARELHDDIGQRLALLAVELQQLREHSPKSSDIPGSIDELWKQTSGIAADIQSLSHELHSSKLEYLGIVPAMRGFCQEFGAQQKVEIAFTSRDLPSPLSPDVSLCLFRVLQEALHNSARHSGVQRFEVQLWGSSDEIHLTVKDSGAGFDTEVAKTRRGLGLISMEERLRLVNGTFSIESQTQRGTTIHARVPLGGTGDIRAAS
jgi:PAS domain S-box-containing protein